MQARRRDPWRRREPAGDVLAFPEPLHPGAGSEQTVMVGLHNSTTPLGKQAVPAQRKTTLLLNQWF